MFIGHDACSFAAKRVTPRVSLGLLIAAANLLDLLWPVFVLLGIEHVRVQRGPTPFLNLDLYDYPWSHSLLMSIVWGALFALGYWLITRNGRGAAMLGALVVSHWLIDFVVHVPDLPLWPGGPKVGLGLWNHTAATAIIESLMFIGGIALYLQKHRARFAFWSLIVFLTGVYITSIVAPPPPSERAVAWSALALWLLPFWAWRAEVRE
ncbi:MAG TPA: hypothetical protein VJ901_00745 [Thermoanaerobaculia bacterium]|nr:hypothetical protein [Thermoanaerobaculia bacterium]